MKSARVLLIAYNSYTKTKSHRAEYKHLSQHKEFGITWKILIKAKPYINLTKRCNPCTTEKFFLICRPHMA